MRPAISSAPVRPVPEDENAADDRGEVGRDRGERDDLDAGADLQAARRGVEGDHRGDQRRRRPRADQLEHAARDASARYLIAIRRRRTARRRRPRGSGPAPRAGAAVGGEHGEPAATTRTPHSTRSTPPARSPGSPHPTRGQPDDRKPHRRDDHADPLAAPRRKPKKRSAKTARKTSPPASTACTIDSGARRARRREAPRRRPQPPSPPRTTWSGRGRRRFATGATRTGGARTAPRCLNRKATFVATRRQGEGESDDHAGSSCPAWREAAFSGTAQCARGVARTVRHESQAILRITEVMLRPINGAVGLLKQTRPILPLPRHAAFSAPRIPLDGGKTSSAPAKIFLTAQGRGGQGLRSGTWLQRERREAMGLMEAQREVTGMVHSGIPVRCDRGPDPGHPRPRRQRAIRIVVVRVVAAGQRLAAERIRTAHAVARQWSGPSANPLAIGRPRRPSRRSHAGGGNGATLRFGAAVLRMDVLRTAEGETDADPPHPRPKLAWRTPHPGAATRKER